MLSRQLTIRFKSQEDIDEFAKLIGQKITDKTKSIWYPVEVSARSENGEYKDE
jgi:hypothetical protein